MLNVIFWTMMGLFIFGTPTLLCASLLDEYFSIIRRPRSQEPQSAHRRAVKTRTPSAALELVKFSTSQ